MSWSRMSKVIERYERLAGGQLKELKSLQKTCMESPVLNNESNRRRLQMLEEQLLSGLQQLLSMRGELDDDFQETFDNRVEPIRRQIQSAVAVSRSLPPVKAAPNPFEEQEEINPYEEESLRYAQSTDVRVAEAKLKAEEAKAVAEATAQLNREMRDLEDIFTELATIVHEQHDVVDSIEESVERATQDVQRGNQHLKKAVQSKAARAPVVAAVVGGLAVGGPVGFAAGSAVAGIAAGIGGLAAGVWGGRWFSRAVKKEAEFDPNLINVGSTSTSSTS